MYCRNLTSLIKNLSKNQFDLRKCKYIVSAHNKLFLLEESKIMLLSINKKIEIKNLIDLFKKIYNLNYFQSPTFYNFKNILFFDDPLTFIYYFSKIFKKAKYKNNFYLVLLIDKNFYVIKTDNFTQKEIEDLCFRLSSYYRYFSIGQWLLNYNGILLKNSNFQYFDKLEIKNLFIKLHMKINKILKNVKSKVILKISLNLKNLEFVTPVFYNQKISIKKLDCITKEISPFGVITGLRKLESNHKIFKKLNFYIATTSIPDKKIIPKRPILAGGISNIPYTARLKAIIEAIERYSAGEINYKKLRRIKFFKIKKLTESIIGHTLNVSPNFHILCRKGFLIFVKNNKIYLRNKIWIPIDLVHFPTNTPPYKRLYSANSSGCAAHFDKNLSIVKSLLELSERDSLMLVWINKISPPIIDTNTLPIKLKNFIRILEKSLNIKIYVLDITLDKQIPCVATVFFNNKKTYPYFHMGACSDFNLYNAIEKSILESISFIGFIKNYKVVINPDEVKTPSDHARFYHNPQNSFLIEFLRKGDVVDYKVLKSKYDKVYLDDMIKNVGGEFFYVDITSNYSKSKGIYVSRVLSTEFVPIWFGKKTLPLNKNRINKIKIMFKNCIKTEHTQNKIMFLHPFG